MKTPNWLIVAAFIMGMAMGHFLTAHAFERSSMDRRSFEHGVLLGAREGIALHNRSLIGESFDDPTGIIMSNAYAGSPFIKAKK